MSLSLGDIHMEDWQAEKDRMWSMAEDARKHLCEVNPSDKFAQAVYHFYLVARLQHLESKLNVGDMDKQDEEDFEWFKVEIERFQDDGKFSYTCEPPHESYGVSFDEDLDSLDDKDVDMDGLLEEVELFEQHSLSNYETDDGKRCVIRDTIHNGQFQEIVSCCIHCDYSPESGW